MANEPLEQNENQKTLSEQLTEDFYKWEQRGRGWLLWDFPVRLEPPFVAFIPSIFTREPIVDDGRKPSLFTVLADKIKSKFVSSDNEQDLQEEPEDYFFSQLPEFLFRDEDLASVTISLPEDKKIDFDSTEQFLLNLRYCKFPVSFEIVGCFEEISFQVICREPDFSTVTQQLRAYFPDAALYENQQPKCRLDRKKPSVIIDFGLSQEFMRPLKAFRGFEPDPLTGIVGSMGNLAEGEMAMLQVLFEPVRNPWHENILKSLTDCEGGNFFADSPEMIKLAQEKIKKPLLAAVIRVAGSSQSEARAWEITKGLAAGLQQVSNPPSNELIPLDTDEAYTHDLHFDDLYYRQSHRTGMLLNTAELLSLVHLPSVSVQTAKLKREIKRTKPAPSIVSGHKLVLGKNIHQGKEIEVTLSTDQRRRHTYIIGATGTGKSTLFLNMIRQDIQQGRGVAVLDPHGDLIERILPYVPEKRFDDVVLLDPSDSEYPVGLNILTAYSEQDKTLLSSDLVGIFRRLSTSWGDQMNSVFANAILAFLESQTGGTLADLQKFLTDNSFRREFLKTVKDRQVIYYWQKQFPMLKRGACSPILTRLDTFLRPKPIRNMVIQKEGLNFHDILNTKKIFLAKLPQGLIGIENSYLLGALLVSKFHQAAMARQIQTEEQREDFYLYIDEFQNFVTESTAAILSGTRKYRLCLVLAHQNLRQLWSQNSELASSVISNPGTRICFRLGDFDAKKLENGYSYFEAKDLTNMDVGEAIVRVEKSDYDFNLETVLPEELSQELARERRDKLIELSRKKYASCREEIEKLLEKEYEFLDIEEPVLAPSKPLPVEPKEPSQVKEQMTEVAPPKTIPAKEGAILTKRKSRRQHNYIQQLIIKAADEYNFKAEKEKVTKKPAGIVDVHLERDGAKIACEVSDTTDVEHELSNIKKRLKAGYDNIILCSSERKFLEKAKQLFTSKLSKQDQEKVLFLTPEETVLHLKQIAAKSVSEEKWFRGRKVKSDFKVITEKEEKGKLKRIGQILSDSVRRKKDRK